MWTRDDGKGGGQVEADEDAKSEPSVFGERSCDESETADNVEETSVLAAEAE